MVPNVSEIVEAVQSLDKNSMSILLSLVLLLFGLFLLSHVSRISKADNEVIKEAKQHATQPEIIQLAERIKDQTERPQEAIAIMIVESQKLAA